MRYSSVLLILPICALSEGVYTLDDDAYSGCSPLEDCRLQTVSVLNQRLAISALCPNSKAYTQHMPLNNSYIFSRLYLDQCYGLTADNVSFDMINRNDTDGLHDPEKNITAACHFTTQSLRNVKPDWSGGIQLTGSCNGHDNVTMLSRRRYYPSTLSWY